VARRRPLRRNQFYKSNPDGSIGATRWGTLFDGVNCNMAVGAMLADDHTNGKVAVSPPEMRRWSGDTSGGTNLNDLATAWRHFGLQLSVPIGVDFDEMVGLLRAGHAVDWQLDYTPIGGGAHSCQRGGTFGHAMMGIEESGNDLIGWDPLCRDWKRYPKPLIRDALERFALRARGTRSSLLIAISSPPVQKSGGESTGGDAMIEGTGNIRAARRVKRLPVGTVIYADSRSEDVLTRMTENADAEWYGTVEKREAVEVSSIQRSPTGKPRPVIGYVDPKVGPVRDKTPAELEATAKRFFAVTQDPDLAARLAKVQKDAATAATKLQSLAGDLTKLGKA
jgi:hypothetical protein